MAKKPTIIDILMIVLPIKKCFTLPKDDTIIENNNPVPMALVMGRLRIFNKGVSIKHPPIPKNPLKTPILNPIKINKAYPKIELKSNMLIP